MSIKENVLVLKFGFVFLLFLFKALLDVNVIFCF